MSNLRLLNPTDGTTIKEPATMADRRSGGGVLLDPMKQRFDPAQRRVVPLSLGDQFEAMRAQIEKLTRRVEQLESTRR